MPDWSVLQWIDAGNTPLLLLLGILLWRVERRLLVVELSVKRLLQKG